MFGRRSDSMCREPVPVCAARGTGSEQAGWDDPDRDAGVYGVSEDWGGAVSAVLGAVFVSVVRTAAIASGVRGTVALCVLSVLARHIYLLGMTENAVAKEIVDVVFRMHVVL